MKKLDYGYIVHGTEDLFKPLENGATVKGITVGVKYETSAPDAYGCYDVCTDARLAGAALHENMCKLKMMVANGGNFYSAGNVAVVIKGVDITIGPAAIEFRELTPEAREAINGSMASWPPEVRHAYARWKAASK